MDMNHICFIVPNYATYDDPAYTFVRQLICTIASMGIKCSVIAPQSAIKSFIGKKKRRPYFWQDNVSGNNKVDIYQPCYASFSNIKVFGMSLSNILAKRAILTTYAKIKIAPNALYAHFWHYGVTAGIIGKKHNLPVFVATGESKIWVKDVYREKQIYESLDSIKGVICVSSKNMQESINLKLAPKEKMIVIPNSTNNKLFYPMNKSEVRKKLGFKEEDFIVAFTGAFNHRKGILRLSEAIQKVSDVKSIYIGSGELKPKEEGVLFIGRLPHDQISYYLNAADIFVLPTIAEGCCNAIIEAMACGLPIISSDLSFNDDILDEQNSLRVDSNNINQIATAIQYLKVNPQKREKMSDASLKKANALDINNRAERIIEFIKENGDY